MGAGGLLAFVTALARRARWQSGRAGIVVGGRLHHGAGGTMGHAGHVVVSAGGKPGVVYPSDICDGVAQARAGMSYSLVSRDVQAAMVEIHALGHPHDAVEGATNCLSGAGSVGRGRKGGTGAASLLYAKVAAGAADGAYLA